MSFAYYIKFTRLKLLDWRRIWHIAFERSEKDKYKINEILYSNLKINNLIEWFLIVYHNSSYGNFTYTSILLMKL